MMDNEIPVGGATKRSSAVKRAAQEEAIEVETAAQEAADMSAPPPSARDRAAASDYAPRYETPPRRPADDRAAAFNPLIWLADGITGFIEEARHNDLGLSEEFWTHVYAVRRESLLAAQALIESLLEQTEGQAGKEQESEPRRARRGGVDIEF
jgi:hypothetical protein